MLYCFAVFFFFFTFFFGGGGDILWVFGVFFAGCLLLLFWGFFCGGVEVQLGGGQRFNTIVIN